MGLYWSVIVPFFSFSSMAAFTGHMVVHSAISIHSGQAHAQGTQSHGQTWAQYLH